MKTGNFEYALPANEPIWNYRPGSTERKNLKEALQRLKNSDIDVPMYIGGEEVRTGNLEDIRPPHERNFVLGRYHRGERQHIEQAVEAALQAHESWSNTTWENRAGIFLKAAELLATKYRADILAATMLGQSKNVFQGEIDAVCELIDFLRFNVHFLSEIYKQQPLSSAGVHNRMEYRPLEGFVLAVTPFNFTAIGGNLPASAALCGNVVVWKCAHTQIFSAQLFMRILMEAGLPAGVINLVYADGPTVGDVCFNHPDFAGIHFTGSTGVFNNMWKQIGANANIYKSYPRIVGETGGKDFVMVHKSADVDATVTALCRGAYEFQGQKCSAASRAYLPASLANEIKEKMIGQMKTMKMGTVENFTNFINAVIDEKSFDKLKNYIDNAKNDSTVTVLAGGNCDKTEGYFIEPTLIEVQDPKYVTMCEELFGPVLTIYVYQDEEFEKTLEIIDQTSPYALTGSIIARDRAVVEMATYKLRNAAGNFYINDKPTGAVVGQQPFGGARKSGTNDKAGSMLNLYRWLSARTIKETFVPPVNYDYPFMEQE